MTLRWSALPLAFGTLVALLTGANTVACAQIVGVEEVALKRNRDSGMDATDTDTDPEPPPDAGVRPIRPNVLQVALGAKHSCARKPEGAVYCWGDNFYGQLAYDTSEEIPSRPTRVVGIDDAIDIAAGRNHTCVVRTSGRVSCWGYNLDGQLGNGELTNKRATPIDVVGLTNALAVAAGGNFSCAIRRDHTVACWGGNGKGQLGTGDLQPRTTPVSINGLSDVVEIAAGFSHACAVIDSGNVACWGENEFRQLGPDAMQNSSSPVLIPGITEAVVVATTDRSTCALTRSGSVSCWGANDFGQLGKEQPSSSALPLEVADLADVTHLQGGREHVCATRRTGEIVCWGNGSRGQLGDGQTRPPGNEGEPSPVTVSGIQNAAGIATGSEHSCAQTQSGAIVCWGGNDSGQLGNGSSVSQQELSPVTVVGFP